MRKIVFILSMMFIALTVNAQHVEESKVLDNTYVSASVGLTNPTTDWNLSWNFSDELHTFARPLFQVEAGKHFTTYYTMAVGLDSRINTTKANTAFDEFDVQWLHKVNLLNVINGYKPRSFELYPMVGVGVGNDFKTDNTYGVFTAAVEMDWALNEKFSILLKPQMRWTNICDGLNSQRSDLALVAGVVYNFKNSDGSHGFKQCDYDVVVASNEELNAKINELREVVEKDKKIIGEQHKTIQMLQHRKPEVKRVIVDETMPPVIGFMKNKHKITPDKRAYLFEVAKKYKGRKLMIMGYADKGTGTHKYNKELSQKRAEAVKKALVEMGMNESDLEVKAIGDLEQPFDDNDMNRVVIIEK